MLSLQELYQVAEKANICNANGFNGAINYEAYYNTLKKMGFSDSNISTLYINSVCRGERIGAILTYGTQMLEKGMYAEDIFSLFHPDKEFSEERICVDLMGWAKGRNGEVFTACLGLLQDAAE